MVLDSGFYDQKIFNYLETPDVHIDYIVAAHVRKYTTQNSFTKTWLCIDKAIEIVDFEYQAQDWKPPRRMVTVRQKISERPKRSSRQTIKSI